MSTNQVVVLLLDVALLTGLVIGNADVKVFVFWVISIMVVFMAIGLFGMATTLAEKLKARSRTVKLTRTVVQTLYVVALIYAGFPILVAVYATAALAIQMNAQAMLAPKAKA